MTLSLIEVYHPTNIKEDIKKWLKDLPVDSVKQIQISNEEVQSRILITAEKTQDILDILKNNLSDSDSFRIIILPVKASIPKLDIEKEKKEKKGPKQQERISVEEIYQEVSEELSTFSKTYIILIILASIVAAIGILYDNIPVVIGSMVIAPLLNPSMALSLGITIVDINLIKKAITVNLLAFFIAISIGIIFGILFIFDPISSEILTRADINIMYIGLAFSGGIAGSLTITKGVAEGLVGVMVAVALLPPIVTCGLLLGSQFYNEAIGAFLIFSVSLVCINLSGVSTFIIQGINPRRWKRKKEKRTFLTAIIIWLLLLVLLIIMMLLYQNR